MRVTDQTLDQAAFRHLQRNLRLVEESREKVASGLRIRKPSDDPSGTAEVMRLSSRLRGAEQMRSNVARGLTRLQFEEGVLSNLTDIVTRARELAVAHAGDSASAEARAVAAEEVEGLLDTVVDLGNRKLGNAFLFGGQYSDRAPLDDSGDTSSSFPPTGQHEVRVAAGRSVPTNHDAVQVFDDTGVVTAVEDLSTALRNDDGAGIRSAAESLGQSLDEVQKLLGEAGSRMNELDTAERGLESLQSDLREVKAERKEVSLEKAVSELASRQTALQSALFALSRAQRTSLVEFMG